MAAKAKGCLLTRKLTIRCLSASLKDYVRQEVASFGSCPVFSPTLLPVPVRVEGCISRGENPLYI